MRDELILSPSEEEMRRSGFHGLLPGQMEYPLGPIDPRLPFPIYFRLTLEQRKIIRVKVEIGWTHQGIEKLLETCSPEEGCQIIRRVNPICPHIFEHHYRLAMGLEPLSSEVLDLEKQNYHLYFLREILSYLGETSLVRLSEKNFDKFKTKFLNSKRLQNRLSRIGKISLTEAVSYGLTGPSLRACQDMYLGDVWSRLCIKLEEASKPTQNEAPEGLLAVTIREGRVRVRTPAFFHAAALPIFLRESDLNDLPIIMLSLGLVGTEIDR